MRRLILKCDLPPGDIVVLTAAVRDLHRAYPESFITDVRTNHDALWLNNPFISTINDIEDNVEIITCHYPLIQESNQLPYHFLHGFILYLNEQLGLDVRPTEFRGDIHLSEKEKASPIPFEREITSHSPRWIICTGGKRDFTIKWWDRDRYQAVVDYFQNRIQFIQVGAAGDYHPELAGVVDLRARTDLRTLINLVHHADGIICPTSLLMHLAAAVPMRLSNRKRPCIVIAGGREPTHWEAYPGHQFLNTIGMFPCCKAGGCWRSRTLALPDDSVLNRSEHLCIDVVGKLPRCMDAIHAHEVISVLEKYLSYESCEQSLKDHERRKLSPSGLDHLAGADRSDAISAAATISLANGLSDQDRIIRFYKNVNRVPKQLLPDLRNKVLTNTPQGLGDTLLLTVIPKTAFDQGQVRHIYSNSGYFPCLMQFNPFYSPAPKDADYVAADMLQRRYDMGNGHFIQRLQRSLGLRPDLMPKGFIQIESERKYSNIALHFEAGDSHAAWQRIYVHPRARQLYPESRLVLQQFINDHPDLNFYQVGMHAIPLDNVQDCTGVAIQDTIRLLNKCEFFIGIISGPMHLATALGLKCVVILNFPKADEIYLPTLKDINLIESEWLYPQNVHLHQEGDAPLVKRLTVQNLEKAISGQVYPYWSTDYLSLIMDTHD
jgi:ADP-heptose:LPS heptosyltransferase